MTRPDELTLHLDAAGTTWVLSDCPATFDLSTVPEYNGQRNDIGVKAEAHRWSLMTRVAGYIAEHERRKASARNYEHFPESIQGDVAWMRWMREPLHRLEVADRHLVKHGAIGPTAARYYGGGQAPISATEKPAITNASETATAFPDPQPPTVKAGDRVLTRTLQPDRFSVGMVVEVSPSGRYYSPGRDSSWYPTAEIVEVLPPRTEGANA